MDLEKEFGKRSEIGLVRIKGHFDGLSVSRELTTYRFIGGILGMPTGKAYTGGYDAGLPAESIFFTPEAAGGENGY